MLSRAASSALNHSSLPFELSQALAAAYESHSRLNAWTSLVSKQDAETAYAAAPRGPLHGVSVGVKDIFCTKDLPTTAASNFLRGYASPFEATVVRKIRQAGGLVLGKTNMDEFGMGSANVHSHFGPVVNPASSGSEAGAERVAGGSSGGSAAAVASGACRVALASDTGGSTRLPASYCGIVGLKPSYGLLSRWGMISYASSLDCVGIMARNVKDVGTTLDVLAGHDIKDPTSVSTEVRDIAAKELYDHWSPSSSLTDLRGLRVGVPAEYFLAELSALVRPSISRTLTLLQSLGAELVPVSLPSTSNALGAYYVLASAEASSNLARYDGVRFGARSDTDLPQEGEEQRLRPLYAENRSLGFGKEVKKRLLLGAFALSADAFDNYYLQAQLVRQTLRNEFNSTFRSPSPLTPSTSSLPQGGVDILVHATAMSTAPLLKPTKAPSASESYMQDILNVPASLAGLPAISVPAGRAEDGWPIGVQLVGQWGKDQLVLRVAEALEEGGCGN